MEFCYRLYIKSCIFILIFSSFFIDSIKGQVSSHPDMKYLEMVRIYVEMDIERIGGVLDSYNYTWSIKSGNEYLTMYKILDKYVGGSKVCFTGAFDRYVESVSDLTIDHSTKSGVVLHKENIDKGMTLYKYISDDQRQSLKVVIFRFVIPLVKLECQTRIICENSGFPIQISAVDSPLNPKMLYHPIDYHANLRREYIDLLAPDESGLNKEFKLIVEQDFDIFRNENLWNAFYEIFYTKIVHGVFSELPPLIHDSLRNHFQPQVEKRLYSYNSGRGYFVLSPPTFEIGEITQPTCHGDNDATVTINNLPLTVENTSLRVGLISLSTKPLGNDIHEYEYEGRTYYWDGQSTVFYDIDHGETSLTIRSEGKIDLVPGYYAVEVFFLDSTESSFCPAKTVFEIKDKPELILDPVIPEYLGSDGTIYNIPKNGDVITIQGNVAGKQGDPRLWYEKDGVDSIEWYSNSTVFDAGNYVFYVTDANGCHSSYDEVELKQPQPLVVSVNKYDPVCNSSNPSSNEASVFGNITLNVTSGGIPGYSAKLFNKDNKEVWSSNGSFGINIQQDINNLTPGNYTLKIWDQGSSDSPVYVNDTLVIIEAAKIALKTTEKDVTCKGDANGKIEVAVVEASGETFWFSLNGDSPIKDDDGHTFGNLSPGVNYSVTCQNGSGCIAKTNTITIKEPAKLQIVDASVVDKPNCSANDGSIRYSIVGGWDNAYPYTVKVSRTGFSRTITIDEETNLNNLLIDNLTAGTYLIEVVNIDGCIYTTPELIVLTSKNPLDELVLLVEDASCAEISDGSVTISNPGIIQGGYTFTSDPSAGLLSNNVIENLRSGNYQFNIAETTGRMCTITKDLSVNVIEDQLQLLPPETTPAYCSTAENGKVSLSATGGKGSDYLFSTDGEYYQASGSFPGLAPGNYVAYVKDKAGCSSSVDFSIASDPEPFSAFVQPNETRCATSSDGIIAINGINYNSTHSHEWFYIDITDSDGTRNEYSNTAIPDNYSISGLNPDSYIVELRDAHNCKLTIPVTVTHKGQEPQITEPDFSELVACEGKTNAKANMVINHAMNYSGIFSVELFKKGNSEPIQSQSVVGSGKTVSFNNLGHESYVVKATDDQRCSVSLEFIPGYITNPLELQDNWGNAPCLAGNGLVTVSATGGLVDGEHDYAFSLNGIPITDGAKAFSPGTSGQVQVTDKYGCSVFGENKSISVRPDPLSINAVIATDPICAGEANGTITPEMQWLPDKYTYSYQLYRNDMESQVYKSGVLSRDDNTITGLPSGIYDLFVYEMEGGEENNCSSDYPDIELKEHEPFSIKVNSNYIKSKGDNSGVCNVAFQGGSGRYNYQLLRHPDNVVINEGESEEKSLIFDELFAGTYTVKIRDVAGCLSSEGTEWVDHLFEINEPAITLGYANDFISNVSCNGLADGTIKISGQGGWGTNYSYALSGPVTDTWQTIGEFENLLAGNYEVSIRDTAGVVYTLPVEITEPLPFLLEEAKVSNATCLGLPNGSINVMTRNGVFADNGLRYQIFNQINGGDPLVDNYSNNKWVFSSLPPGSYSLLVTDKNECSVSQNFEITEPEMVVIDLSVNTILKKFDNTGVITGVITGGNQYFDYRIMKDGVAEPIVSGQTKGDILAESLYAGNYTVLVKDTANCNYEGSEWMERRVTLQEPESSLMFVVETYKPVSCNGLFDGELHLKGVGGWGDYQFSINNGVFSNKKSYTGLAAGDYLITVRDDLGITWDSIITVEEPDILTATFIGKTDVTCYGASTGTISYDIKGGTPDYQLSVDDVNWQTGNAITNLPYGSYSVNIRDARGCTVSGGSHSLSQAEELVLVNSSITESACTNNVGAINAEFSGGTGDFSYYWSRDVADENNNYSSQLLDYTTASVQNLYSGRYVVVVEDENSCRVPFEFFVPDNGDLSISSVSTTPVTCFGYSDGTVQVNASLGTVPYIYTWSNEIEQHNEDQAWQLATGTYRVIVRDANGCVAYKEFEITSPEKQGYIMNSLVQPLCYGGAKGEISLTGTGGTQPYTYNWSSGETESTLSNAETGTYQVTIGDSNGCSAQFEFDLSYQKSIKPQLGNDTLICHYSPLKLDVGDFNSYNWQSSNGYVNSTRQVELNQPGIYYLTVTDKDNCIGADTLDLKVSTLDISHFSKQDISCFGAGDGMAQISVLADDENYSVLWSNESTSLENSSLLAGNYWVKVSNTFGCERSEAFIISEPEPLSLVSNIQMPYCMGIDNGSISVVGNGGSGDLQYNWLGGQTTQKLQNLTEGVYTITLTDAKNCSLTEVYNLSYVESLKPDLGGDRTICKGNNIYLYPGEFENYTWRNEQFLLGVDSVLKVSDPGIYNVEVDKGGCYGRDTVVLDMASTEMAPLFLAASVVPMGDTLLVVEVSQPKPLKIAWQISGAHKIVEEGEYHCKVVFEEEGSHSVTLSAFTNTCVGESSKMVLVVPAGNNEGAESGAAVSTNNLLKLSVSPNPSNGNFTAAVKLNEAADVTFYLVRIDTGQVYETRKRSGLKSYNESFSHSGVGQFALFAESGGERLVVKVIMY